MLEPGQVIDRYVVEDRLGQGGMAVVYRVRHLALDSVYALKLLTSTSEAVRARLIQEGRVQSQLRHRSIVAVHDVIDVDGAPGLVMDFVDGPSLKEWLEERRPSQREAEDLFKQILSGVSRAHKHGVVHRDLKPGNVLLEVDDDEVHARVADFGLVKAAAGEGGMVETRTGMAMGTPAYMAPEQVRDAKNVDERADIWSLGCILYELLCGRPPFMEGDLLALFNAIADGRYPAPRSLVPDLDPRLEQVVLACLTPDLARRAASCEVVRGILTGKEEFTASLPPMAADATFGFDDASALSVAGAPSASDTFAFDAGGGLQEVVPSPRPAPAPPEPSVSSLAPTPAPAGPAPADSMSTLPPVAVSPVAAETMAPAEPSPPAARSRAWVPLVALLLLVPTAWFAWSRMSAGPPEAPAAAPTAAAPAPSPAPADPDPVAEEAPPEVAAPTPEPVAAEPAETTPPAAKRPAAEPAPRKAAAAPAPEPEPDPEPPPEADAAPTTGTVTIIGDAELVRLRGADGRDRAPGALPPGRYTVHARFGDEGIGQMPKAGEIEVVAGEAITLRCKRGFRTCVVPR